MSRPQSRAAHCRLPQSLVPNPGASMGLDDLHRALGEEANYVNLMCSLTVNDAPASVGVEFLWATGAVQEVGEIERGDHPHPTITATCD